jgi:hypothetical protein
VLGQQSTSSYEKPGGINSGATYPNNAFDEPVLGMVAVVREQYGKEV